MPFAIKWLVTLLAFAALAAVPSSRADTGAGAVERVGSTRWSSDTLYRGAPAPRAPTHGLALTFAFFTDGGWTREQLHEAAASAAGVLAQCGVVVSAVEVAELRAPRRLQYFATPRARELVKAAPLPRPAVYFVADTLQQPAFEAEAIGRANSGTRPELADTVWITRGARHLPLVLAHELAHVLMDSGEHVAEPGNLMRQDTAPENTRLDPAQCARMRTVGEAHGLLTPLAGAKAGGTADERR
ncbi:MAG: hypothetical protein FJY54_16420 [Betaproteobacteria bacterium]|nr:hypothetical protein [Betaproteobacteria bacterium]